MKQNWKKKTLRGYGCTASGRCDGGRPVGADDVTTLTTCDPDQSTRRDRFTEVYDNEGLHERAVNGCDATGGAVNGGGVHLAAGQPSKRPRVARTTEPHAAAERRPANAGATIEELAGAAATAGAASEGDASHPLAAPSLAAWPAAAASSSIPATTCAESRTTAARCAPVAARTASTRIRVGYATSTEAPLPLAAPPPAARHVNSGDRTRQTARRCYASRPHRRLHRADPGPHVPRGTAWSDTFTGSTPSGGPRSGGGADR